MQLNNILKKLNNIKYNNDTFKTVLSDFYNFFIKLPQTYLFCSGFILTIVVK